MDAWRYADPMSPGWTWDRHNPYVAATREPSARIGYVLVGLPTAGGAGQVRSVRLIEDRPVHGIWPSDHAGVLAELSPASEDRPEQTGCAADWDVLQMGRGQVLVAYKRQAFNWILDLTRPRPRRRSQWWPRIGWGR